MPIGKVIGRIGIALTAALWLATPAVGDCTGDDHNRWLEACTEAISAARRPDQPVSSPWDIVESTNPVLRAAADASLTEAAISVCSDPPPIATPCTVQEHRSWLQRCEEDALHLQSQPRFAIYEDFVRQGGISTRLQRDYVHRRCSHLQVSILFEPADPREDLDESPNDIIVSAVPFLGFALTD